MPDCFISFASSDRGFADKVRDELIRHGLKVFFAPVSIEPGQNWSQSIVRNLREAKLVLFLASKNACTSAYVQQEVGAAYFGGKTIVPIVWDMAPKKLPGWAKQLQAVDLRDKTPQEIASQMQRVALQFKASKQKSELIALALIRRETRRWHGLLILTLTLLGGCALTAEQKVAVRQFSESAATLGDVTTSELRAMRNTTLKMTMERLLLAGKSADPRLGDQTSLDRGFDFERVEIVSGATRALAAYGKSLLALTTDTQSAELKAASNEFVASLGRVPDVKGQLSDKQLKAIGTVIQEVGGLWIEWKRKQAVTTIVKESEQVIERLCDLLIRDFGTGERGWVRLQLQVIEAPLLATATNTLFDGRTYNDRNAASQAIQLLHDNRMRRSEVLSRVTGSAEAMKKANKVLVQAIENSEWSLQDIHDFAVRAHSLQTAVNTIVNK